MLVEVILLALSINMPWFVASMVPLSTIPPLMVLPAMPMPVGPGEIVPALLRLPVRAVLVTLMQETAPQFDRDQFGPGFRSNLLFTPSTCSHYAPRPILLKGEVVTLRP